MPWGDLSTAYRSTGIPNITTYLAFKPGAVRLARYFGTSAEVWLRLQVRYDLESAEQDLSDRIYDYLSHVSLQDLVERKGLVEEVGCRSGKHEVQIDRARSGHSSVRV